MRTQLPFALLASALACSVFAVPAQALRTRVFVSGFGTDSGTCSFAAPCRTMAFAYDAVVAGGEITLLDSAGNNPLTTSKSLTITVLPGIEAGIAVTSGAAITINAGPNDIVTLQGLTLDGAGSGGDGILFNSGGSLKVVNCSIRNFCTMEYMLER